jgi:hypothetical protein
MTTGGSNRRFADTEWADTAAMPDNPLERPPVRMSKKPVERVFILDAKFAIEDGLDVVDKNLSDSEFGTLFGEHS